MYRVFKYNIRFEGSSKGSYPAKTVKKEKNMFFCLPYGRSVLSPSGRENVQECQNQLFCKDINVEHAYL